MKQLLTATALAAMLALLPLRLMASTYAPPQLDRPSGMIRVGDVFTLTLHCNCTQPEDSILWAQSDKIEYLDGYTYEQWRITDFDAHGTTTMRVRAVRPGRWDGLAQWEDFEPRYGKLLTNIALFNMNIQGSSVYLPMMIAPPGGFEIPQ